MQTKLFRLRLLIIVLYSQQKISLVLTTTSFKTYNYYKSALY